MGVRLMNLGEGDSVATVARIAEADLRQVGVAGENGAEEDAKPAAKKATTKDNGKKKE
jgi:hypothetical protein